MICEALFCFLMKQHLNILSGVNFRLILRTFQFLPITVKHDLCTHVFYVYYSHALISSFKRSFNLKRDIIVENHYLIQ